jgi:biopolymer transport protein ExbB/TolQ
MAETQRLQISVDRTPYRACFLVAFLGASIFLVAAYSLIQLGGSAKHFWFTRGESRNSIDTSAASDALEAAKQKTQATIDQAKVQAQSAAQKEIDAQKAAAAEAAKDAVKQEAQKQLDTFKDSLP